MRARMDRQLLRIAMGETRDWIAKQTDNIVYETLWELDFDWTAPEDEERWREDD